MRTTSIIAVVLFIVLMILRSEEVNAAEDIAVCSELKGVEYYHATSMVPENMAGWREAAISNGKTVLKRIEENEYNILFFDARGSIYSAVQDGGKVVPIRKNQIEITILHVTDVVIEIYTFYKEHNGSYRYDLLQGISKNDYWWAKLA